MSSHKAPGVKRNKDDLSVYQIGTMMAGTDRALEDSISGYTPVVIDRRGNRRFHGAFTGGFSAGYFNTVNTAQGYKAKYGSWTSSRNNKNKQQIQQTPMDFMDDEDMATNTNLLATQKSFNSLNNDSMNAFNKRKKNISNVFGAAMSDYLVVDKHAIFEHSKGIQLLKKCGWRTGKSLGDKATTQRLKLLLKRQDEILLNEQQQRGSNNHLMFGEHIFKSSKSETINDTKSDKKMVSIYRPKQKTDVCGIGFNATKERSSQNNQQCNLDMTAKYDSFGPQKKKRKLMSTARHGLSALEEVEIGDDVYMDDSIGYDAVLNDEEEEYENNDIVLMADKDRRSMRHQNVSRHRRNETKKKKKDERLRSRAGRLPIDGFVVSSISDHFEYSLKEKIKSRNYKSNKHNFEKHFDGFKKFQSNKMEIDQKFATKFAKIDLSVGSFLCRDYTQKTRRVNVLNDTSQIPQFIDIDKEKKKLSKHLSANFTASETMTSDAVMNGLSAGLTKNSELNGKNNKIRKAKDVLDEIRKKFGNENAEKLLRFDVFLAKKIGIESPIEDDKILDDGNSTQFELNKEQNEFNEAWIYKLKVHKDYFYPNKRRLRVKGDEESNEDMVGPGANVHIGPKEAAKRGLYGLLTRSEEVWVPNALLCKRCNVRDPYKGMYDGKSIQFESKFDRRMSNKFGGFLLNVDESEKNEAIENDIPQSKGAMIAKLLEDTESNEKEPPILELKQLKTWNMYLMETEKKERAKKSKKDMAEMKEFVDGILNDSDSEKGDVEMDEAAKKEQEMSLFKSIFENTDDEESDSEEDQTSAEDEIESMNIPSRPAPVEMKEVKRKVDDDDSPVQRKKFKFVSKSERMSKGKSTGFGSFGNANIKKGEPPKQMLMNQTIDDKNRKNAVIVEPKKTEKEKMIWAVIESDSTESEESRDRHKRKKKKKKSKKKKRRKGFQH